MTSHIFVADRQSALDAARLIAECGAGAHDAALRHADVSRDRGNVVHFCRWRQVARLIGVLDEREGVATRH